MTGSLKPQQQFTAKLSPGVPVPVAGGSQTPWASDIDGAGNNLSGVNAIDCQAVIIPPGGYVSCPWFNIPDNNSDVSLVWALSNQDGSLTIQREDTWAICFVLDSNGNIALPNIPQYADLAAAQAALGAGTKILWCDPTNAVFVT